MNERPVQIVYDNLTLESSFLVPESYMSPTRNKDPATQTNFSLVTEADYIGVNNNFLGELSKLNKKVQVGSFLDKIGNPNTPGTKTQVSIDKTNTYENFQQPAPKSSKDDIFQKMIDHHVNSLSG